MTTHLRSIPTGWHRVLTGKARSGDKFWSALQEAWLPVTHGFENRDVMKEDVPTVIRKDGENG